MTLTSTRFFFFFLILVTTPALRAQITLTNAYFPRVGDSLLTNQATDEELATITFQPSGEDLTWEFGNPEAQFVYTEVLEAVADDDPFVGAEARLTSAAFDYEYYRATDTTYYLVGLVGSLPFFREDILSTPLVPPRPVRRAGITYGDKFVSTSVREIRISVDSLPEDIRNSSIGGALANYDSIRVTSSSERHDEVDAYGTLTLRGETYTVLREKRVEQMETRVFVKSGTSAYIDVTGIVAGADPATGKYVGLQPEEGTYYFWAEGQLEPVVEIEFDAEEKPTTFLYKRGGKRATTATPPLDPTVGTVRVYPNPATGDFRIDYELLRAGSVSLTLRDAAGRSLRQWPAVRQAAGSQRFSSSLGAYPHGVYYLELLTDGGRTVQKLVKQ